MEHNTRRAYVIRYWCPVDLSDLPGVEGWLTDLAVSKGLFFAGFASVRWQFVRRDLPGVRYRLEPVRGKEDRTPDGERVRYYSACGWEYQGSIGDYYHVYLATDPDTPELYDDPVSQSYVLESLERRQLHNALFYLGLVVLYSLMMVGVVFLSSSWPLMTFLESTTATQLLLVLSYLFTMFRMLAAFRQVHRLRRMLRTGLPMEHKAASYRFSSPAFWAVGTVTILVLMILVMYGSGTRGHTVFDPPFSLAELEPEGGPVSAFQIDQHSPLLRSTEVWQDMETLYPPEGEPYTPGLTYEHFRLTLPFLASPLLDELVYRYTQHHYFPDEYITETLDLSGFDRAVLARERDGFGQKLFLSRDGQVLYVSYFGWTELLEHMDTIETLFD